MNIDQLTSQFTSIEELKIFVGSQYKQIQNLSKENKELREKLEKASNEAKAIVKSNLSVPANSNNLSILDDAKTISQIQLNILKEKSFEQELSTDEAKRVELYHRILNAENDKKEKPLKADVEILKESDLLKLVTNE